MDTSSTPLGSETVEKKVALPKQLEAVTKAATFPLERHRWNTNEEVAAILIAFEHHQKWQSREVELRPASGSMLLYNRKKVRYRKDGYCWKKRKDGKTTREDHMKLKVQGVECIYGCYVHSAILPTFHRRCYWLLQNPDLVLVHYLNVPLQDENKLSLPSLQHVTEKKEWSRDDLVSQLRPMFAGACDGTNNQGYSSQTEETVQSIVVQLMESQQRTDCACLGVAATCESATCKNKCRAISPKTPTTSALPAVTMTSTATTTAPATATGAASSRMLGVVPGHKAGIQVSTVTTTAAQPRPLMAAGGASLILNSAGQRHLAANTPLILNLSQLQGSNGLIILSSQTNAPISIVNNGLLAGNGAGAPHPAPQQQPQPSIVTTSGSHHNGTTTPAMGAGILGTGTVTSSPHPTQPAPAPPPLPSAGHSILLPPAPDGQSGSQRVQIPSQVMSLSHAMTTADLKAANSERNTETVLHSGLVLKQEMQDDDTSNVSMEECTSQSEREGREAGTPDQKAMDANGNQPRQHPEGQEQQQPMAEDGDTRMELSRSSSFRESLAATSAAPNMEDLVSELNLKNEMQSFHPEGLVLSADDLHTALTASLPVAGNTSMDDSQHGTPHPNHTSHPSANNSTPASLDSIEAMRSSMVSPTSTDFNFDAFDILDVLPDFDSSEPIMTDMATPLGQQPPPPPPPPPPPAAALPTASLSPSSRVTVSTAAASSHTTTSSSSSSCSSSSTSSSSPVSSCTSCQSTSSPLLVAKPESRAGIANITDFSPEWAYSEGGVKVLVTGPWYSTTSPYTVLFDHSSVPATLVQSGVLRCFCPAHAPGLVSLQVACEGYVISNSCAFEYKAKQEPVKAEGQAPWFDIQEDHLKMALLNKLEHIEKRLSTSVGRGTLSNRVEAKMRSQDALEVLLLDYVDRLGQCTWSNGHEMAPWTPPGLSLLHLVAALGYTRLTLALIKWRSEQPSVLLEAEVDALSRDDRDNTPLMWACARGCLETAIVLYHWNPAALGIYNRDKQSPLATARSCGNAHIAEHIERLEIAQLPKPPPQTSSRSELLRAATHHHKNKDSKRHSGSKAVSAPLLTQQSKQATKQHALFSNPASRRSLPISLEGFALNKDSVVLGTGQNCKLPFLSGDEAICGLKTEMPMAQAPRHTGGSSSATVTMGATTLSGQPQQAAGNVTAGSGNGPNLGDLTIEIPASLPGGELSDLAHGKSIGLPMRSASISVATMPVEGGMSRSMRLLKRSSVEVLPGYLDSDTEASSNIASKNAKTTNPVTMVANRLTPLVVSSVDAPAGVQPSQNPLTTHNSSPNTHLSRIGMPPLTHSQGHRSGPGTGVGVGESSQAPMSIVNMPAGLRSVSSDPHLVGLNTGSSSSNTISSSQMLLCDDNPMISVNDRDLNSPVMFMQTDAQLSMFRSGLTLEDIQRETVAMETDSPRSDSPYVDVEKISEEDDDLKQTSMSFLEQLFQSVGAGTEEAQSQIVTLANQIIAAMPERIKLSPSSSSLSAAPPPLVGGGVGGGSGGGGGGNGCTSVTGSGSSSGGSGGVVVGGVIGLAEEAVMMVDMAGSQRERSSSHSSFSSYSSVATPPCGGGGDDSGISTPLEGLAFEEYRYPDLGTPASSLSPASSCLQSPYSFTLDSPPPTTAEFTEYFNAPTTFMEKDFSQLTLSDHEQRRLYEAAKIIQNFYRHYKDKKQQAQKQRQREIEAAILIQSYYRRYKQYAYYKKMTQAAVLIQSQFRSYYAQKRFRRSRQAATVIQNQYRTYKEHERFKKSRNAAVIIQQRFRSHYQRKRSQEMARQVQKAVKSSSHSSESSVTATDAAQPPSTDESSSTLCHPSAATPTEPAVQYHEDDDHHHHHHHDAIDRDDHIVSVTEEEKHEEGLSLLARGRQEST